MQTNSSCWSLIAHGADCSSGANSSNLRDETSFKAYLIVCIALKTVLQPNVVWQRLAMMSQLSLQEDLAHDDNKVPD